LIRGSIISPRETFTEIKPQDLSKGVFLVIVLTVSTAVANLTYGGRAVDTGFMRPMTNVTMLAISGGVGVIGGWLIQSMAIHLTSSVKDSEGGFKRFLALTGFASTPLLIRQLLRVVDALTINSALITEMMSLKDNSKFIEVLFNSNSDILNVFGVWSMILVMIAVIINYQTSKIRSVILTIAVYTFLAFIKALITFI